MKRGTTAILLLAFVIGLATVSARAQGMGGGGHKHQKQTDKTEPQKSKADEKAYNAALKSVPDKPKPDPWQGARELSGSLGTGSGRRTAFGTKRARPPGLGTRSCHGSRDLRFGG